MSRKNSNVQTVIVSILTSGLVIAGAHQFLGWGPSREAPGVVSTSEVRIVDERGTIRARLGVDLPDAVIDGEVTPRGAEAAGLMLYDETGQERGGYVILEPASNIVLTLDSRAGQVALFAAGPEGGSTLRVWNPSGDAVELRTDPGGARFTAIQDGKVVFQQPEIEIPEEACEAYREALAERELDEVMSACAARFRSDQCRSCLERSGPAPGQ